MRRQDMLELIEAWESYQKLDDNIAIISESGIDPFRYKGLHNIYSIIKRNSIYYKPDDESNFLFEEILYDEALSVNEKYDRLKS